MVAIITASADISQLLAESDTLTLSELLRSLCERLDGDDLGCEDVCDDFQTAGAVERLCALLEELDDPDVAASCCMLLCNLASAEVNTYATQVKERLAAARGLNAIASQLSSTDTTLLYYAAGACMNCCTTLQDVATLKAAGALSRLVQLSEISDDEQLAALAAACVENAKLAIGHAATEHMIHSELEDAAVIALQARAHVCTSSSPVTE